MPDFPFFDAALGESEARAGKVTVTEALLVRTLSLPAGTRIYGVESAECPRTFTLWVEHEDLPVVYPGCRIPEVVWVPRWEK